MKLSLALGALLGLALTLALVGYFGTAEIASGLATAGWGILAVIAFHLTQMVFSSLGWQMLLPPDIAPRLIAMMRLRWIREGVNNLLPVAQVGGELVGARLLRHDGVPFAAAAASVTVDLTMEMTSQIIFTALGVALLALGSHDPTVVSWSIGIVAVAAAVVVTFVAAQRFGAFHLIERALVRLADWKPAFSSLGEVAGLHHAIARLYAAPMRLGRSFTYHLIDWLLGGLEVMLALHFVGVSVDFREGLIIESLGQASRALGFAIPGSLGVQEGGFLLACGLFGISPQSAIELSLLKRIREVALGLPALIAWHVAETRRFVDHAGTPVRLPATADGE